ncbi:MAG: BTAD domain-containing putative transcriptional regulator, partial [Anaerolineae bacterium]
ETMARLSLSCLGPFQVTLDGQPVTGFKSNKVRALLAYLAVEAERPHRREVLAGLLWPDWPDREALSNLRYTLSDLRGVIGDRARSGGRGRADGRPAAPPFLLVTRDSLRFNTASDHVLDVAEFLEMAGRGDVPGLEEAAALYRGSFLEGFSLGDGAPFEEWALLTRERLDRRMSSALHQLAAAYERQGAYGQARATARRQVEREPWDEVAHRQVMRALALSGQRGAALAQYEACRRLLAEELDVEPGAETTRLYEQIRAGALAAPPPQAVHPPAIAARLPAFLTEEGPAEVEAPAFVARERELAQLAGHLEAALAGQGRVVFVTGDAGSGKTALIQEFGRRAQATHPDLVVAGGQGNAHTGVGDPYLPFREILGLLSGDVEAQWAAGAMTRPQARRLWHLIPLTVEALVRAGPDLIDLLVSGLSLLERAGAVGDGAGEVTAGRDTAGAQLRDLVARKADARGIHAGGTHATGIQQSALFEQYSQVLRVLAGHKPLLLTVDDLQWADGGSLHLLFHLGRRLAGSRILLLGAYRPAEVALGRRATASRGGPGGEEGVRERHPLAPVVNELKRTFGDVEVDLERVEGRPFVEALLDSEPNRLGDAFRQSLYRRTQGHPLFTVELLRGMQERGDLVQDGRGRWAEGPALDWETLPARVEAVVAERIGRLPRALRDLLRIASVEGETFTAEVAARVQGVDEGEALQRLSKALDRQHRLVSAQGIRRLGGRRLSRYRFRHILFQRYLYGSLDPVEQGYLHEQVGSTLEALYADREAAGAAVAPQLAWHFEQAGIAEKAIRYLHQAGERAVRLSAYEEGIAHLMQGLALLPGLPDSPERDQQELDLRLVLGTARIGQGLFAPEVEAAYARARELGQAAGETTRLCMALGEMAVFHYVRAEHHQAWDLAEEAMGLAQRAEDPLLTAWCHWALGFVLFALGDFVGARDHLERVTRAYDPEQHPGIFLHLPGADAGTSALAYKASCLWCLGYPEQALEAGRQAVALARRSGHLMSLADALCFGSCTVHAMRRDGQALKDDAQELVQLGQKAATWLPPGLWYRGAALVLLGQLEEGMAQLREGMAIHRAGDKACSLPPALSFLAEAQAASGRPKEALATLAEALALVEETDERHWEAELHRLRAELLLSQGDESGAEASLHQALDVARRQGARSWELRAATGLARLWQGQGRGAEARSLLAGVYGWFTEGFETPDLQVARALLDELG